MFLRRSTKGYLFCQNGIQKGKGLDLGAEPHRIKVYKVPLSPEGRTEPEIEAENIP